MQKNKFNILSRLVALGVTVFTIANTVGAQTKFERPDTVPTYSEYRDIDECMASLERQYNFYTRATRFWRDTAVHDRRAAFKPYPDGQLALGKGCFNRFSIDSVEDQHVDTWSIYLSRAGRNDDAWKLQMRRLLAAPDSAKKKAFTSAMSNALYARPINVERVQELYQLGRNNIPEDSLVRRYLLEYSQVTLGMMILDSQITSNFLDSMIVIYAKFPSQLKNTYAPLHEQTYRLATADRRSDSVRAGTNANLSYEREVHSAIHGDGSTFSNSYVEAPMPEINSEYWFHKHYIGKDTNLLRKIDRPHKIPAMGKVSVISFIEGCNNEFPGLGSALARTAGLGGCISNLSVLARLQKKFPQVEFITVTKTFGFVGASATLTPELEADSLSKQYMNNYGLGGFFTVAVTDFIRIPGLDNRRVDNDPKYRVDLKAIDPSLGNPAPMSLVIDTKGRIVGRIFLNPYLEEDDTKLLQAAVDRKND